MNCPTCSYELPREIADKTGTTVCRGCAECLAVRDGVATVLTLTQSYRMKNAIEVIALHQTWSAVEKALQIAAKAASGDRSLSA